MTVVMAAALVTGTVAHCCANMFVWTISNVVNVGAVLCIRYYHVHDVSDGTFNAGYGPRRCFWTFRRNYAQDTGFFHKVPGRPEKNREIVRKPEAEPGFPKNLRTH